MKRLYVAPAARQRGIGIAVARFLINRSIEAGYAAMRLDTLPSMTAAHAMYASLGFTRIDPYRHNPVPGATFWQLDLRSGV